MAKRYRKEYLSVINAGGQSVAAAMHSPNVRIFYFLVVIIQLISRITIIVESRRTFVCKPTYTDYKNFRQVMRGRQGKPLVPLECPKPYGIFPHPNDCGKFVNCCKGRAYSQDCAPGTLFNSDLGVCDHAYKVTCKLSRTPNPKPTPVPDQVQLLPISTTTTTPQPWRQVMQETQDKPLVPLECPKPYGIFPHPNDCGKFVNCSKGRAHSQDCAPGTLFNSDLGECDHAYKVTCKRKSSLFSPPRPTISSDSLRLGVLPHTCGKRFVDNDPLDPLTATPTILRGSPAKPGAYPWQVGLRIVVGGRQGTLHSCGAAVLSEYYIITAAHCFDDDPPDVHVMRVGDHDTESPDPYEEEFTIDTLTKHPEYGHRMRFNNDIALIRIKAKDGHGIRFGPHVQPICLPPEGTSYTAGLNCTVSGWGSSVATGNPFTTRMKSTTIPILGDDICRKLYNKLEGGMFCAGFVKGGVDTCKGDSGGALVCSINGQPTAMGLTSFGYGCGRPDWPGIYTRVVNYLPWIYSVLSS